MKPFPEEQTYGEVAQLLGARGSYRGVEGSSPPLATHFIYDINNARKS